MKRKTVNYIFSALFTAIICISAQIVFLLPSGVPLTLQTLAICLCGYILQPKYATLSVVTYLLLGFFGLPVFSYFSGGPAILLGKNGGFLFGFIFLCVCCSIIKDKQKKFLRILMGIIGIIICHIFGVVQFSLVFGTTIISSFILISLPTILKDLICVTTAFLVSQIIFRRLKFN